MESVRAAAVLVAVAVSFVSTAAHARPVSVRVQWGGGTPQAWSGGIEVVTTSAGGSATRLPFEWRTLSSEADAAAMAHDADGAVLIHQPRPLAMDGIEITVDDWRAARLVARIALAEGTQPAVVVDVPLADLVVEPAQQSLDDLGNRLVARASPGDALRVAVATDGAGGSFSAEALGLVRRPGDQLRLRVEPLIATTLQGGHAVELRMRLKSGAQADSPVQATMLQPLAEGDAGTTSGKKLTGFEPVVFDVTLPAQDGVAEIELEAIERGGLRWSRSLASRVLEVAAVDDAPGEVAAEGDWGVVYDLDPGSPRLHERLRRLPGMSLPSVALPEMPLPSLARTGMSLPKFPSVPLPNMPLPNVAAMVPRLSGLLPHGHSTVVTHPLGPMLRLPPARSSGEPAWEGIVLAGLQPGMPHAVEIDYPSDQDAVVGVLVLEPDAAGVVVEPRHSGGFEVRQPRFAGPASPPRSVTHRFVFWPTTKNPLVFVANPSCRTAALIGRVRVVAGPARLAPADVQATPATLVKATGTARRTHGFLVTPELAREFGGVATYGQAEGRLTLDWGGHIAGAHHFAEMLAAQAAGGSMITVYAQGAALWPSRLTRHAPRWDGGTGARDVLAAVARIHARHRLGFVPAASFDGPLPELETALAAGRAGPGIACVGRDGRQRRLAGGGLHYNILEPAVQRAVESIVVEMAGRVRGSPSVGGVAVVLPHDGWLHLPGLCWPLDDDTFARFAATLPAPPATEGETRFGDRARLVEGPLREAWLGWRGGEIARFHARLAAAVAAVDDRWSLYVVPTTLFAEGSLAASLRSGVAGADPHEDPVRLAGLDPGATRSLPAADRLVYVWPQVHSPSDGLRERAVVAAASRLPAVARAAGVAPRNAVVLVEQPVTIDVDDAVPHGPFGSATARQAARSHPAMAADRSLAGALSLADAEIVFDMALATRCSPASPARRAYEAAPLPPGDVVADVLPPLTIRVCRSGNVTWAQLVNAADAPATARIRCGGRPTAVVDGVSGTPLPLAADAEIMVPLEPWGVRGILIDGGVSIGSARLEYAADLQQTIALRIDRLRQRRAVLETPVPLAVLDNPAFELGSAAPVGRPVATVAGWEVVESRRGTVTLVPGAGTSGQAGRGLEFSSLNGLATLRSNPFAAPATGRISVAAWLRVADAATQPPLRIAIEGLQDDREYYRFAAVGGLTGGRPLTGEWSQFVLQIDDLPSEPVESLRVRFDLLGPGRVQIDDLRVFDLAFDESQRSQITTAVSVLDHQRSSGDLGGCVVGLDGYWPAFLESFVTDAALAAAKASRTAVPVAPVAPDPAAPEERQAGGMFDRFKGWWQ